MTSDALRREADKTNLSLTNQSTALCRSLPQEKHYYMTTQFIFLCVCFVERQNHARELVREADLSQWDALVIMSGDGLLFEVKRDTYRCALYSHASTHTVWLHTSVGQ